MASTPTRLSTISSRSRDYYPTSPTPPPLKPDTVVPTASYMERGRRWMEKEEALSLRDAMEEMDLRDSRKNAPDADPTADPATEDDETRLYNAALNEAAELVWEHQHGVKPRPPEGAYKYRSHLRKDSYAHARAAAVGGGEGPIGTNKSNRNSYSALQSPSPTSSDGDQSPKRNESPEEASRSDDSPPNKGKSYGGVGGRFTGGRRSSMKRNISGEVERPFSGDQIWEEPEAQSGERPTTTAPPPDGDSPVSLHPKPPNAVRRSPFQRNRGDSSPTKRLERIEIHRNPPTRSRNAQYQVNNPVSNQQHLPDGQHLNGVEIRGQDIREATSMRLKDRSSKLPEPTAVSDSPGRPIVSFDANWKAAEESTSTDARPDPTTPASNRYQSQSQAQSQSQPQTPSRPMDIPSIVVAEDPSPRPRAQTTANVPSISIAEPDETSKRPTPTVNIPSIAVDEAPSRRNIPSIATPRDSPVRGSRPLPTPGARGPQGSRELPRSQGHWSPAPGAAGRAGTLCNQCERPIEGKFVALAGSPERFHPHCFRCYTCNTRLEAMEISPEPDAPRAERLERIRRRAAGEVLDEKPGMTMAEDGDERLRFYCHLDWHELYAPRCKHCTTPILGEHIVALGAHWHYGHFFCAECGDPFEHGMTHIEKDGYAWCINCQTKRTERRAPKCKMCKTAVIGQYIKALGGEWHEHCFRCAECKGGFDDGQIFPKETATGAIILCTKCRARELKF
ncbi:hypothetical protein ACHAQJ_007064 [Trichoderma viride]